MALHRSFGLLAILLATGLRAAEAQPAAAEPRPLVIAHCMACCSVAYAVPASEEDKRQPEGASSWREQVGGFLPEMIAHTHDPLGAARAEIALARQAGIDAFGLYRNGYIVASQFAAQTEAYWRAAAEDGTFKVYPEVWNLDGETALADTVREFALLRQRYDDAWLRLDGKRVVLFAEEPKPAGTLARLLAPLGGRAAVYVAAIAAGPVPGYGFPAPSAPWLRQVDAVNFWHAASYGDDLAIMPAMAEWARQAGKEHWMRAMPSFFQLRPQAGPVLVERLGMAGYHADWQRIRAQRPRVAYITTWNDPSEDSGVLPDVNHGRAFLELTRYFTAWHRQRTPPAVAQEQILAFHHPQLTETPMALPPGCGPCRRYNWQATPPTDYVGLVVMLREPAEVRIDLSRIGNGYHQYETIARRRFPAGVSFWLAYHPLASADDSAIRNADANTPMPRLPPVYPAEQADFAVTRLAGPLKDRFLNLAVERGGAVVGYFQSHRPIVGTAAKADLSTTGDVFLIPGRP